MPLKLDCPRRELHEALSLASHATRTNTPQPILQNLKLVAKDSSLTITGCDGEMWVEREVACLVTEPGEVLVPAALMRDLVQSLVDGSVELTLLDHQGMLVQQGASEYRVLTLDADDFPTPPPVVPDGELTLPAAILRDAIDSVIYAVSTDAHRVALQGVQFSYDGETLTLVATDTHRLAVRRIPKEGIGASLSAILPERALRAIKALPVGDEEPLTLVFGAGRMSVEAGGAKVVAQLLSGAYPAWERVVPTENTRAWAVESDQLKDTVKRALILAKDSAFRIRFRGEGDKILLSARSEEKGEAKEEVPMVSQDGDIEIAFNGRYVVDAIGPIKGPGVRIELSESSRPAVFRSADEGDHYFCVVMPMALN